MDKRRLAGTDLDVSVICYGPMRAAQDPSDPNLAMHKRAMSAAIERGVNLIHSSYEYGVRWMMHDVLKDHSARHDLLHVIKAPVPDWDDPDFDADKLEHRIDEALTELCTDRIALIQWMWRCRPNTETDRLPLLARIHERVVDTFERLRDKGKVGHLACFPYFPESAAAAMSNPAQKALIAYYNPLELEMSPVIDGLAAGGRGFLAIRPLYEGVLTDQFAAHSDVPQGHRLAKEKYVDAFAARQRLASMIPESDAGMTRFAIRFPLLSANCASVVVGLNSEAQVSEICNHAEAVTPNPETVARVRSLLGQSLSH